MCDGVCKKNDYSIVTLWLRMCLNREIKIADCAFNAV